MQRELLTVTRLWRHLIGFVQTIRPRRLSTAIACLVAGACVGLLTPAPAGAIPTPDWTATYDVSATPTQWLTNRTQTYTVRVTNDGNQKWTGTGPNRVRLGVHFANTGGCYGHNAWDTDDRFDLPNGITVNPGMTATFSVTVRAPNLVGNRVLEAEMVKEGVLWFPDCAGTNVSIGPSNLLASINASATPTAWRFSETKTFSVRVTNTGDDMWNATGNNTVRLGVKFISKTGSWFAELTDARFFLPHDMAPGTSEWITVTVTAPPVGVWYYPNNIRFQMVKEQVRWFPYILDIPVSVTY